MKKQALKSIAAASGFAFRTPLFPMSAFSGWSDGANGTCVGDLAKLRETLADHIADPAFLEALFVASPDLLSSLEAWRNNPDSPRGLRVERTLTRYFSRMATRATPFGLFAAVSVGEIKRATQISLPPMGEYVRRTRLDNDYLFALAEDLVSNLEVRQAIRLFPNTSLYRAGGRLRYAEARLVGKDRSHHLVAVDENPFLQLTLERAQDGALRADLASALVADDDEISLEDGEAFVDELVAAQLLVTKLEPPVTGVTPLSSLIDHLGDGAAKSALQRVRTKLTDIDAAGVGAQTAAYAEVASELRELGTTVELKRLFQVDTVAPCKAATISARVCADVERAIAVLETMTPKRSLGIDRFAEMFSARYEEREVPLELALDEEVGIGFEKSNAPGADASPLLAGLPFPNKPTDGQSIQWRNRDRHLLNFVISAAAKGEHSIELSKSDVDALAVEEPARLPMAFAAMATVVATGEEAIDRGDYRVIVGGAAGPSGARLLGRFAHGCPDHHRLVRDHIKAEEALLPDAVFAEVVHLPEGRIGNILCRPVLRNYEIPYLGHSGASADQQLPISDLLVSVRNGRVRLRSRRLDQEVIPRLTSAHNFSHRSLGVYRFLCSLQSQGGGGVAWSWGPLESAPFLPRVCFGRLVFARAQWNLGPDDISPLANASKGFKGAKSKEEVIQRRAATVEATRELKKRRNLPRFVVVADSDNELVVDFDNALSVDSFVALVRSRSSVSLVELYPGPDEQWVRGPQGQHCHQAVFSFTRAVGQSPPKRSSPSSLPAENDGVYPPGSDWSYTKIYCGTSVADEVLAETVWPIAKSATESGSIDRWFFLRYADPDSHLRVRFRGEPERLRHEVLPALDRALGALIESGYVSRVETGTYSQELSRYGGPAGIELAEQVFHADSVAVCQIVELLDGDEGADARWRLTLRGIDMLFDDLGFEPAAKRELMTTVRDGFANEFSLDKTLGKELGKRFRKLYPDLRDLLARDPAIDGNHDLFPGFEAFELRSAELKRLAPLFQASSETLSRSLGDITLSLIHMHANRLLRSSQRAHELVLYDLLKRHYDALSTRSR